MDEDEDRYSSSEDKEESFRNFDYDAAKIVKEKALPQKSSDRYLLVS